MSCATNKLRFFMKHPAIKFLDYTKLMAQAESYKALSLLFGAPVEGLHNSCGIYDEFVGSTKVLDAKMHELAKKLKHTSEQLNLAELSTEFDRLFILGDVGLLACPFSSAYENMKSVDRLSQWIEGEYKKADFVPGNAKIPFDHIVTELEFICKVIEKAAAHLQNNEAAEANYFSQLRCNFIADHALKWVPDFTRAIIFSSKSPFYLQLAILVRTMLVNCIIYQEARLS